MRFYRINQAAIRRYTSVIALPRWGEGRVQAIIVLVNAGLIDVATAHELL